MPTVQSALWLCVLVLPWQPWRVRERLEPEPADDAADVSLEDVTVLIPGRDEAAVIGDTLAALGRQGRSLRVVLVDDRSGDETAEVAREAAPAALALDVHAGAPLAEGWTGKLWALEQGRRRIETPLTLLLDADITLRPGMIQALLARREESGAALVSVMAALRMRGGWERLLLPAFIFFFRLLYPFHLSNGPGRRVAAAAGGCVLVETSVLDRIGGFEAIRGALVDDCGCAAVKEPGTGPDFGVSRGAGKHRTYPDPRSHLHMVARTAYTQAPLSPVLLLLCHAAHGAHVLGPDWQASAAACGPNRRRRRARRDGALLPADDPLLPPLLRLGVDDAAHRHLVSRHDLAFGAARLGRPAERMEGPGLRAGA